LENIQTKIIRGIIYSSSMNIRNVFITAIRAISRNKMRSSLTSIGIIIGVSSVIVMVGIGNSAKIAVRDKIYTYGANAISISKSKKSITNKDVENLKRQFPQIKYITPRIYKSSVQVKYKNRNMLSRIDGVNIDYFKIKEWNLQYGRYFSETEVFSISKIVVIGNSIRQELFGLKNPVGKILIIKHVPFKVVGSLVETGQSFSGRDFDNIIVMPYTTAGLKIVGKMNFNGIVLSTYTENMVNEIIGELRAYFRRMHSIPIGKRDDFRIRTSKEKLKMAEYISKTLSILLAGIASISLFVGGIGIMNIMLVSVSERTREIGIRMSIGAKKRDILIQFLIESFSLSSIGGIVGITLGLLIYYLIIYFVKWPFLFSLTSIIVSFSFSCAVGIFFGYYPALKASNLKPIDALRIE